MIRPDVVMPPEIPAHGGLAHRSELGYAGQIQALDYQLHPSVVKPSLITRGQEAEWRSVTGEPSQTATQVRAPGLPTERAFDRKRGAFPGNGPVVDSGVTPTSWSSSDTTERSYKGWASQSQRVANGPATGTVARDGVRL